MADDYHNAFSEEDDEEEDQMEVDEGFGFSKKKRKLSKGRSKESAMLGIFKEFDSDEEEEDDARPRMGGRNYGGVPGGVSFVSAGSIDPEKMQVDQPSEEEEEEQEEEAPRGGLGSSRGGLGSSRGGLGSARAGIGARSTPAPAPSSASAPSSSTSSVSKPQVTNKVRWSKEKGGAKEQPEFEKYTKGVGSKLLKSMGWKPGEGLGSQGQGINRPIEVKVRPKNRGLGFDFEELTRQQREDFMEPAQVREGDEGMDELRALAEGDEVKPRVKEWKRKAVKTEKKVYAIPTGEVVMGGRDSGKQKMMILDMRGEQPALLSDLSSGPSVRPSLSSSQANTSFLPELQHNLALLSDMKEAELISLERKRSTETDNLRKYKEEKEYLDKVTEHEKTKIERLESVAEIVRMCKTKADKKDLSLRALAKTFYLFREKYAEEYRLYSLHLLAPALAMPLLKEQLESWRPLLQPALCLADFRTWMEFTYTPPKDDLSDDQEDTDFPVSRGANGRHKASPPPDVYTQLVVDLILPKFRQAITNEWDIRQPDPLLSLLDTWRPLLPPHVFEHVLDQLVFPRLTREVESWNPRTDTVPIHAWIHPWLAVLGTRLDSLYPIIRGKFTVVLQAWHPSDASAHIILSPWHKVFDPKSWESLLERAILPKLEYSLHNEFVIDPRNQNIAPFDWILQWEDLIPIQRFVLLLDKEFFPKWHRVLLTWLTAQPDLEQISRWYQGWKAKFSAQLVAHDRIRMHFNHALSVMNNAMSGLPLPAPPMPLSGIPAPSLAQQPTSPPLSSTAATHHPSLSGLGVPTEVSFKEMLEQTAESHGLALIPSRKRHEGKQLYELGSYTVLLENQVAYIQKGSAWVPISIEDLMAQ